jgi:hypothetical protein
MITRYKLTEQIKRLIKGGNPSSSSNIWDAEIMMAIGQVINKLLKTDYFSTNLPSGETMPSGYVLASYDGIQVERYKDRSRAKMPVTPILLPRNLGVFHVGPQDEPDCFYIPIPAGQGRFISSQDMLSDLLGIGTYEQQDGWVVFDRDVTGSKVNMQLVVMDIDKYSDYDVLPVPADMEMDIVEAVVARFSREPIADKVVDANTEPTKMTPAHGNTR